MSRLPTPHGRFPTRLAVLLAATIPTLATAQTLERIQTAGRLVLGYEADARPFSFTDSSGNPHGFTVALCQRVAEEVKTELGLPGLVVEWKPVAINDRFTAVREGRIDLLCGADSTTLSRREVVSFSLPVFPSGTGAMLRSDSPTALRELLAEEQLPDRPIWRGAPARTFLEEKRFSAVVGTLSAAWMAKSIETLELPAMAATVDSYDAGVQSVLDGESDVFFGALPILLDNAARSARSGELVVLPRHFTYEPLGLALPRGDDDFRLIVDRALSHAYYEEAFREVFYEWFGTPDESLVSYFKQTVLPE